MNFYRILILSIFICSCKNSPSPERTSELVEIPEDFVNFYERFHTDSLFQIEHVVFPLSQKNDSTKWTRESWQMHMPFNSQNGNFKRSLDNFQGIITETIMEKNGSFLITRRFSKMGGEYQLIYYSLENRLDGWIDN